METATAPHPELARIIAERAAVVLDCGHAPTPATHFHSNGVPLTTGYATWPDGTRACEACTNAQELADFTAATDEYFGYLSGDGKSFTTWPGAPLARITEEGTARTGWHGSEVTYVRAVDSQGRRWYGKNGGRGMALRLKLSRASAAA